MFVFCGILLINCRLYQEQTTSQHSAVAQAPLAPFPHNSKSNRHFSPSPDFNVKKQPDPAEEGDVLC